MNMICTVCEYHLGDEGWPVHCCVGMAATLDHTNSGTVLVFFSSHVALEYHTPCELLYTMYIYIYITVCLQVLIPCYI